MNQLVEILKPTFLPWVPKCCVITVTKEDYDPFDTKTTPSGTMASLERNKDEPCSIEGCDSKRHISRSGRCSSTLCTEHYLEYHRNAKANTKGKK